MTFNFKVGDILYNNHLEEIVLIVEIPKKCIFFTGKVLYSKMYPEDIGITFYNYSKNLNWILSKKYNNKLFRILNNV